MLTFTLPGFGRSTPPRPTVTPAPVSEADEPAVTKAKEDEARRERLRRGRATLILTTPRGLEEEDELGVVARPQARKAQVLGRAA